MQSLVSRGTEHKDFSNQAGGIKDLALTSATNRNTRHEP